MDLEAILKNLRAARDHLDGAIAAIERIGPATPRGRPPEWLPAAKKSHTPRRCGPLVGSRNNPEAAEK